MKNFRELVENEEWTKEDLIAMIKEEDLDDDDIQEITELVMDIVEFGEFDGHDFDEEGFDWDNYEWDEDEEDSLEEKMSGKAKRDAAKKRRKPAFKKAKLKKAKCEKKFKKKIASTKGTNKPKVCNMKGKLIDGFSRSAKRKLAKTRKKNKSKIIK